MIQIRDHGFGIDLRTGETYSSLGKFVNGISWEDSA